MKFHKLISRTIVVTALLSATLGGAFSGISVSANSSEPTGQAVSPGASSDSSKPSNLQVNNGLLTLDNVPTLNFGNAKSQNGSNVLNLDTSNRSKNDGLLEVTDYRNNSANNNWTLTADMDPLNSNSANNQNINTQWEIDLFNQNSDVPSNLSNRPTPNVQNTKLLSNNNGDSNDNTKDNFVMGKDMNNADNNNGYGVNQLNYNNSDDAQLITPNVAPTNYSTNINWHLSTTVTSKDNSDQSSSSQNGSNQGNQNQNKPNQNGSGQNK